MNASTTQQVHPKTGLPVQEVPTFQVGDLVTETFLSDGTPGVVVAVTPKTVWVSHVDFVGNFREDDAPGYNGYGDTGTIVVDPESVEKALARGKDGARKYVLRVSSKPSTGYNMSIREREQYGETGFHRAKWGIPNSRAGSITPGARFRRDPHV